WAQSAGNSLAHRVMRRTHDYECATADGWQLIAPIHGSSACVRLPPLAPASCHAPLDLTRSRRKDLPSQGKCLALQAGAAALDSIRQVIDRFARETARPTVILG